MAARQEQEPARTEVEEVAKNVLRMQLPISLPGLGHVNCYALVDDHGAAVIDPGLPTPASFAALGQRLGQAGLRVKDIHTVIVTHSHGDHFGGTGRIVRESGAKVVAHRTFTLGFGKPSEPEVSVDDLSAHARHGHDHAHAHGRAHASHEVVADDGARTDRSEGRAPIKVASPDSIPWGGMTPWGGKQPMPPLRVRMRWRFMRLLGHAMSFPPITLPVEQGDVLRLAGREWRVTHTPGHTNDHICLHSAEEELFLSGDHVLPTITPHISGLSLERDPLAAFFRSLDLVAATPHVGRVLPAHGHPFTDLAQRCEAIKRHHDERLAKVRSIARELGPTTVRAFSQRLFRQRSWGPMAESETYAHLEHLRLLGDAEVRRTPTGELLYTL